MLPTALRQARRCFTLFATAEQHALRSQTFVQHTRLYSKGKDKGKDKKAQGPKFLLSDEELSDVLNYRNFRDHLDKSLKNLGDSYLKQLSITNTAGSLDTLEFPFEDSMVTLAEVAQMQKKPNLVVLQFGGFPEAIKPAIKAIEESGVTFTKQQEGTTVYIHLAKLSREQRESMAKNAKTLFQKCKDSLLQVERKFMKEVQTHKDGQSQDLIFNATKQVKLEVENTVEKAETMMKAKQKELLSE